MGGPRSCTDERQRSAFAESRKGLRLAGSSGGHLVPPTPLRKKGLLELVAQDSVLEAFGCLQGGRLRQLSGQPVPVLDHPHSKNLPVST